MAATQIEKNIQTLLEEKFKESDYSDCFLVEVSQHPSKNRLEVYVDSDSGITPNKCQRISRYLEMHLDEHLWLGSNYQLEVSSPGISRPLKYLRQYKKNAGRTMEITLKSGETATGELTQATSDYIVLTPLQKGKKGKKSKQPMPEPVQIAYEQITQAIVKPVFR